MDDKMYYALRRSRRAPVDHISGMYLEWFGEGEGPAEMAAALPKATRLSAAVDAAMDRLRGGAPAASMRALATQWAALVGPDVAKVTRPAGLSGGTLFVEVSHPAWAVELRPMAKAIAAKANTVLGHGACRGVRFRAPDAPRIRGASS